MLVFFLYLMAAFFAFAAVVTINGIGKRRQPITPAQAAFVVVIQFGFITTLVFAAEALRSGS